jgi:hypothetical protein
METATCLGIEKEVRLEILFYQHALPDTSGKIDKIT